MPKIGKAALIAVMRRTGHGDDVDRATTILPDPIDIDRDVALLESLGLSRSGLMEDMGGSP